MKKWCLFFMLLMAALVGCNNGSSSGGGGTANNFMTGYWSGQWSETRFDQQTGTASPRGGPLSVHLTQNGKQITGDLVPDLSNILGGGGKFSATLSNPNGSGNIEVGVMWNDVTSRNFHGTYSGNQIYCQIGPATQGGTGGGTNIQGTFTLTR
jgi:hypothetical protein